MSPEDWDVPLPIEGLEPPKEKPKKKVNASQTAQDAKKITYRRFHSPNKALCQQCVDESIAAGMVQFCNQAAYTRTVGFEEPRLLCFPHAQQARDRDGLEALRAGDG